MNPKQKMSVGFARLLNFIAGNDALTPTEAYEILDGCVRNLNGTRANREFLDELVSQTSHVNAYVLAKRKLDVGRLSNINENKRFGIFVSQLIEYRKLELTTALNALDKFENFNETV